MAFTVLNFKSPGANHPRYNFDQTLVVGSRGNDAKLLQVLLNMFYFDQAKEALARGFVPLTDRLVEDGIIGHDTTVLASDFKEKAFQLGSGNLSGFEHPEAQGLDPMRKPGELSPRLKKRYFIDLLNDVVSTFDAKLKLGKYPLLASDPSVPVSLRNALSRQKSVADKYRFGG